MTHSAPLKLLCSRFPAGFRWGVASSAFQIEGAPHADGKGESIWDEFCRRPGTIADGSDGSLACDHYRRLDQDLDLIASLGIGSYRFSIAWTRLQPDGHGTWNEPGFDFYARMIDGLLSRNVEPFPTLYHWDLPAALQRRGGWTARATVDRFADYAQEVARRFGDRVKSFATHNEPWVTATVGHELGVFAPGMRDRGAAMQVSHHCLVSHGLATQAIRAVRPDAQVGIVLNLSPVFPATDAPADHVQASREDGLLVRWYLDALLKGHYPDDMLHFLGPQAPRMLPGDAALIAQPLDYLGVNYYHPIVSTAARPFATASEGATVTDMGWEVAPDRFTDLLMRIDRDYDLPPLLITENGAAYQDVVVDGGIADEDRQAYIESHIRSIADSIEHGVDVRGYYLWSLLDNFEWALGYTKRFGIYYVDYKTQERILKHSGVWYRALADTFNSTRGTVPAESA